MQQAIGEAPRGGNSGGGGDSGSEEVEYEQIMPSEEYHNENFSAPAAAAGIPTIPTAAPGADVRPQGDDESTARYMSALDQGCCHLDV